MNPSSQDGTPVDSNGQDPMPPRSAVGSTRKIAVIGAVTRVLMHLPRRPFEAAVKRSQKPSFPSTQLVPSSRVEREVVAADGAAAPGVPVTWIDRPRSAEGAVVHLHGGAYVFGDLPGHWTWLSEVSEEVGIAAAMVHYRMPPEAPFPVALDDAVATIRALAARGDLVEGRWVLSGDSAGGGLAVATLQRLRDEGGPLPAGVVLMSPWTDLTMTDPLVAPQARTDRVLNVAGVLRCARMYAGPVPLTDPRLSPRFGSAEGLPPALILAGSDELLLSDSRHLRDALAEAGVPVTLYEQPGGQHAYPLVSEGPATRWAVRRQVEFMRRALGRDA